MAGRGLNYYDSGHGQVAGCCGHGNELWCPIKCAEFLDWLNSWLFKKDCVVWSSLWLVGWLVGLVWLVS